MTQDQPGIRAARAARTESRHRCGGLLAPNPRAQSHADRRRGRRGRSPRRRRRRDIVRGIAAPRRIGSTNTPGNGAAIAPFLARGPGDRRAGRARSRALRRHGLPRHHDQRDQRLERDPRDRRRLDAHDRGDQRSRSSPRAARPSRCPTSPSATRSGSARRRNADGTYTVDRIAVVVPSVRGTVSDVTSSGFKVTTRDGSVWTIAVNGSTEVPVRRTARISSRT